MARYVFLSLIHCSNQLKPKNEITVSVRQKGGFNLKNNSALFCVLAALAAVSPADAASPQPSSCSATFAGRIAYTTG